MQEDTSRGRTATWACGAHRRRARAWPVGAPRKARTCRPRWCCPVAPVPGSRQPGPGSICRNGAACRSCASRGSHCFRPATNSSCRVSLRPDHEARGHLQLQPLLHSQRCCGLRREVSDLGIVPDQREATRAALRQAAAGHDLILTSGGVSVGEEDHIKPAVQAEGRLDLWQIGMKPGKPFAYGTGAYAGAGAATRNPATSSACRATRCPAS
jgi:hypothetical protein